jgi:iron complex outermembrane receptor protein
MDSAATLANVLGGVYTAVYTQSSANTEEDKLLPRLGGVFDISKSFSVFANYSEGMRGQPFALFTGAPKPEHSRQKEGGLKFDNGTWAGQLAIYKIDRSNVAVTDPASASFRSLTDGEQQSKGLDADLTWHPTPAFSFLVNYAHTDAEFTKTVTGARAGNQLPGVPQNSGRIWANYVFQQQELKGFSIGLGVYLQSGVYVDNANLYKTDSYHRIDAALSYQAERYNVGLTVKNLTNEDYYQYYSYLGGRVAPDPGTTAYLSVAVKY